MGSVAAKFRRVHELIDLTLHTPGWHSKRRLFECYSDLGGAVSDGKVIDIELKCGRERRACRMRRSDVFTLAEIFHERQYGIHAVIPASPLVIDAGANIGVASLWISGRYPGATIHAFEPEPTNFQLLEHNLRSITDARANRAALGDIDGEIDLHLASHGAMHSTSSAPVERPTVRVPVMRLDSYLERLGVGTVDLLKLDVEGAELSVLKGLGTRIADVGVVVGEVHERVVDVDQFYAHLRSSGFSMIRRIPFRDGRLEGVHGFEASRTR